MVGGHEGAGYVEMVTRTYPLEDINQGYQDLRDGKNIRGVLVMEPLDLV
jgi:D-arabinose 1-dehydrogenase-like Zn-dependent alcohol dehydrogenase